MVTGMDMARRYYSASAPGTRCPPLGDIKSLVLLVFAAMAVIPYVAYADDDLGGKQGGKPAWFIEPRLTLKETFTDNGSLSQSGGGGKADQITEISPGIRLQGRSARLKAYFDYSLSQIYYAQSSHADRTRNALTTTGTLEALENWLFVDFNGSISQQTISAFGTQSTSDASLNSNSTETTTYALSPYIQGRLGGGADYTMRYRWATTDTQSSRVSGNTVETWSANLRGDTGLASFGWALDATSSTADYSSGRRIEADRLYGTLIWRLDPQFRLRFTAGREADNYITLDKESRSTHGYGFDWSPTTRTSISAFRDKRAFGNGHSFSFNHRTPSSAWRFTDTRDIQLNSLAGTASLGTAYDLMYALTGSMVADPSDEGLRALLTTALLSAYGISPTSVISSGFLANQAFMQRKRELAFTLLGSRNSLTFMASQSRRESLSVQSLELLADDFRLANVINQRVFSVNWSHRLTAESTVNAVASKTDTSGNSSAAGTLHTTQKTLTVNFSTRLGAKTTASLGLRRAEFDSESNPYTENAVTGTLTTRF